MSFFCYFIFTLEVHLNASHFILNIALYYILGDFVFKVK